MTRLTVLKLAAAALLASGIGLAAEKSKAKESKPDSAPPATCSGCREKHRVLDPSGLGPDGETSRPAYEAAARYPATIDGLHCYCGCSESPNLHHVSLLTCFTTLHATGCEICRGEAMLAGKMKTEGSADGEIRQVIDSLYANQK